MAVAKEDAKHLNSILQLLKTRPQSSVFSKLDYKSIQVKGYADAGFATNNDLTSQLAMVVLLMEKFGHANSIHYSS